MLCYADARGSDLAILCIGLTTGNACNRCTVYCVVRTKQAQRLQTGLRLRDRNATKTLRSGRVVMILVVSTGVNAR